jgi:hypothetical protein
MASHLTADDREITAHIRRNGAMQSEMQTGNANLGQSGNLATAQGPRTLL